MTDLEMTKLCAEALGWKHLGAVGLTFRPENEKGLWCMSGANDWWQSPHGDYVCNPCTAAVPDPLHDDAQVMTLIKTFKLQISAHPTENGTIWLAAFQFSAISNYHGFHTENANLNYAITECVAKFQKAKG